jgi:hypothetical protein
MVQVLFYDNQDQGHIKM